MCGIEMYSPVTILPLVHDLRRFPARPARTGRLESHLNAEVPFNIAGVYSRKLYIALRRIRRKLFRFKPVRCHANAGKCNSTIWPSWTRAESFDKPVVRQGATFWRFVKTLARNAGVCGWVPASRTELQVTKPKIGFRHSIVSAISDPVAHARLAKRVTLCWTKFCVSAWSDDYDFDSMMALLF